MSTHASYVDSLKKASIALGKDALISYLSKTLPFLFIPVVGPIVSFFLGKLVEILITKTEFAIFIEYIDMRVDAQGSAFSKAALANYQTQQNGTPDEKAKAEKELITRFRALAIIRN